jgi:hypothetical protein
MFNDPDGGRWTPREWRVHGAVSERVQQESGEYTEQSQKESNKKPKSRFVWWYDESYYSLARASSFS